MSSLKFSYWSSPHIRMKSGLNASSAARVFSSQPTRAARWRVADEVPSSLPHSARIGAGQPAGLLSASGSFGFCSMRFRIHDMRSSGPVRGG
jgi:hypothetical protein